MGNYFWLIFPCCFYISFCASRPAITVFIHGTLNPVTATLVNCEKCPPGLTPAIKLDNQYLASRIGHMGYILDKADPARFALKQSYFFGWSGKLNFDERKRAAAMLYKQLKQFDADITLICHSHGCNVALNLGCIAQAQNDPNFAVKNLILCAPPVQEATKYLIHSPVFKKIYTFYSTQDFVQVLDPQGLYSASYVSSMQQASVPLFSQRLFSGADNIVQTRILLEDKNPSHWDFISDSFLQHLSGVLRFLEQLTPEKTRVPLILNISKTGSLRLLFKNNSKTYFIINKAGIISEFAIRGLVPKL